MPVIVVAADTNSIPGTGYKIFPGSVVFRRFVFKGQIPAVFGQREAAEAADQQKRNNHMEVTLVSKVK
jgi:hypothetical protein